MSTAKLLAPIIYFLQYETPKAWIDKGIKAEVLSILFIEHLACELNVYVCK
ncbi:MAG: hypothetical protein HRT54_07885 [Colwellia sp.]|nr:hypothetical protein [Colwellia sp.]